MLCTMLTPMSISFVLSHIVVDNTTHYAAKKNFLNIDFLIFFPLIFNAKVCDKIQALGEVDTI